MLAKIVGACELDDPRLSLKDREVNDSMDKHDYVFSPQRTNLRKEMQAGFTVLPAGGVSLVLRNRGPQPSTELLSNQEVAN